MREGWMGIGVQNAEGSRMLDRDVPMGLIFSPPPPR
jgi:hypothetical protein